MHAGAEEYDFLVLEFVRALAAEYFCFFGVIIELRMKSWPLNFGLSLIQHIIITSYCYKFNVSLFERVAEQLAVKVHLVRHSRTALDFLMPTRKVLDGVLVAPRLDETEVSYALNIFGSHLMREIELESVLAIL